MHRVAIMSPTTYSSTTERHWRNFCHTISWKC